MLKVLFHDDSVSVYFGKYCDNILSRVRKKNIENRQLFHRYQTAFLYCNEL